MMFDRCSFAHLTEEKDVDKDGRKVKLFECVHGKKLTWKTARAALGLPPDAKADAREAK